MKQQINRFLEHATDALDDANFLHQDGRVLALANRPIILFSTVLVRCCSLRE